MVKNGKILNGQCPNPPTLPGLDKGNAQALVELKCNKLVPLDLQSKMSNNKQQQKLYQIQNEK